MYGKPRCIFFDVHTPAALSTAAAAVAAAAAAAAGAHQVQQAWRGLVMALPADSGGLQLLIMPAMLNAAKANSYQPTIVPAGTLHNYFFAGRGLDQRANGSTWSCLRQHTCYVLICLCGGRGGLYVRQRDKLRGVFTTQQRH
jgi:hypothetical protein